MTLRVLRIAPPALLVGLATAALAVACASAAPASASARCAARAGTLAVTPVGRVWHRGHVLYGCTTAYGRRPNAKALGPWAPGTRVAWDGVHAAWTVVRRRGGVTSDRIWARSAEPGAPRAWLRGARAVPPSGASPGREARVLRIRTLDAAVGWVTRSGEVVLSVLSPQADPVRVGSSSSPLAPTNRVLLVDTFTWVPAASLAASLALKGVSLDGDECGYVGDFTLTVVPPGAPAPVGARWTGGYERPDCG